MSFSNNHHGGLDVAELRRLGLDPAEVIDFSVNSNPFGPPPAVLDALGALDIARYPDRDCLQLRESLSELNAVAPENVLVGNGSAQLIWLAAQALLRSGQRAVVVSPTFSEYRRAAETLGTQVVAVKAAEPYFRIDVEEVSRAAASTGARVVFLCNPNNPSGQFLPDVAITALERSLPSDCWLVLDEAYRAFVPDMDFPHTRGVRTLLLRSMTKDFALAGLRLGYALGPVDCIARMRRFQPTWSVSAPAQAAGLAALRQLTYYRKSWQRLHAAKIELFTALERIGCEVLPTDVHYALMRASGSGAQLRTRLLSYGLQVRDCASFGLAEYVRISTRLPQHNHALLHALSELRAKKLTEENY